MARPQGKGRWSNKLTSRVSVCETFFPHGMNNTTAFFSFPLPDNLSEVQKSDLCNNLCGMANTLMTGDHGGNSPNNYVYYIYILLGGLFLISEGVGLSKKIPQGSIFELLYHGVKKVVLRESGTPQAAPTSTEISVKVDDPPAAPAPAPSS